MTNKLKPSPFPLCLSFEMKERIQEKANKRGLSMNKMLLTMVDDWLSINTYEWAQQRALSHRMEMEIIQLKESNKTKKKEKDDGPKGLEESPKVISVGPWMTIDEWMSTQK